MIDGKTSSEQVKDKKLISKSEARWNIGFVLVV